MRGTIEIGFSGGAETGFGGSATSPCPLMFNCEEGSTYCRKYKSSSSELLSLLT
jgi:hypothetical protein